jgi:hypothetical protein
MDRCSVCLQADLAAIDSGRDSSEAPTSPELPYIRALWNFHAFENAEFATGGPVYVATHMFGFADLNPHSTRAVSCP